jgi:hypothetical protein
MKTHHINHLVRQEASHLAWLFKVGLAMIWTQKLITTIKGQGHRCRWKCLKIGKKPTTTTTKKHSFFFFTSSSRYELCIITIMLDTQKNLDNFQGQRSHDVWTCRKYKNFFFLYHGKPCMLIHGSIDCGLQFEHDLRRVKVKVSKKVPSTPIPQRLR